MCSIRWTTTRGERGDADKPWLPQGGHGRRGPKRVQILHRGPMGQTPDGSGSGNRSGVGSSELATASTGPNQARRSEKSDDEKLNHERGEKPLPVNAIEDDTELGKTVVERYGEASGFCPRKPRHRRGIVTSRETR